MFIVFRYFILRVDLKLFYVKIFVFKEVEINLNGNCDMLICLRWLVKLLIVILFSIFIKIEGVFFDYYKNYSFFSKVVWLESEKINLVLDFGMTFFLFICFILVFFILFKGELLKKKMDLNDF